MFDDWIEFPDSSNGMDEIVKGKYPKGDHSDIAIFDHRAR